MIVCEKTWLTASPVEEEEGQRQSIQYLARSGTKEWTGKANRLWFARRREGCLWQRRRKGRKISRADLLSLEEKPKRDLQLSVRAEKLRPDDDKVED